MTVVIPRPTYWKLVARGLGCRRRYEERFFDVIGYLPDLCGVSFRYLVSGT